MFYVLLKRSCEIKKNSFYVKIYSIKTYFCI